MKARIASTLFFLFILFVPNAASQWQQIPTLNGVYLSCMVTTDDSTILVGGLSGTLLRSTDNGATWTSVWGNGITADTILALGAGRGYVFASAYAIPNNVFRSSDDGVSWNLANQGLQTIVFGFLYVDTVLYAATMDGVYSSTNDGDSWRADTVGLGYDPDHPPAWSLSTRAILHIGERLIAIKDFAAGVYASAADTVRWYPLGLKDWYVSLAGIDTMLFGATSEGVFMYTGNDTTWEKRSDGLPSSLSLPILRAVDSLLFVYTGSYSNIYVSADFGMHWEVLGTSALGNSSIQSMASTKTHLITETSANKWRLSAENVILSAEVEDPKLPGQFSLDQNFPNPFNPETVISYRLSAVSEARLSVFDVLGREIAVLVNEKKWSGEHRVTWHARNLPSGVYFLRLEAELMVQTRKMVLMR